MLFKKKFYLSGVKCFDKINYETNYTKSNIYKT